MCRKNRFRAINHQSLSPSKISPGAVFATRCRNKRAMKRDFIEAIKHRRTYYDIGNSALTSQRRVVEIVDTALLYIPSAFNVQSTRIVVLFGKHHIKLWEITKDTLREIVPEKAFERTQQKIDHSFAAGCGTILFFEDREAVETQKRQMPTYAEAFDTYSAQTSAMHQFAIWTMLCDAGYGASLQHYNPLIDKRIAEEWDIPTEWRLMAEMPFGNPLKSPETKIQHKPIAQRRWIFGEGE